jgi:hypothetical protein
VELYEQTRAAAERYLVAPGHEESADVVAAGEAYRIVTGLAGGLPPAAATAQRPTSE